MQLSLPSIIFTVRLFLDINFLLPGLARWNIQESSGKCLTSFTEITSYIAGFQDWNFVDYCKSSHNCEDEEFFLHRQQTIHVLIFYLLDYIFLCFTKENIVICVVRGKLFHVFQYWNVMQNYLMILKDPMINAF